MAHVISNLLSLGAQLLPVLSASAQAPSSSSSSSSSSSPPVENHQIETELKQLMRLLERIKATLYDAEDMQITNLSVKLWLKELREVAYDAEDVLDEYRYEVLRAQVEARDASPPNSRKRKHIQVPDGMLHQIQQIRSKFAEIASDRIALQLSKEDGPRRCNSDLQVAPTSHFVVESDIIGREREKNKLIDLLSSESQDGEIISVVAIVGTGGIGKTTLAQLVYNDQRIRQKFDTFGWVCISEDFNVERLTREVVESITGESCGLTNLSTLQKHIHAKLRRKRIFLILDDVWNENRNHWELFLRPFKSASMVKILVTTRNDTVARIMQTMPTFKLGYMSEEQSWQMFQHYAFDEVIQSTCSDFVKIGKQIMKKCGMLPLAIKSIASLLRHEPKEESWREILENELWESDASNEIFRPLQISYARLPIHLKPCFLYCSMFPKDYRYNAEDLVKLWISQGYVQTCGLKNAEKIGLEYAKQLCQRSFFECEYEEYFGFTLHDMIHDLARSISGHGCFSIEGELVLNFPEQLYHLYVSPWVKVAKPPPTTKFATLRTLIVGDNWPLNGCLHFSEAQKLRAVKLVSRAVDLEPQFSFVNLKHLRYLSLSYRYFTKLPECTCNLYNLQNLNLSDCPNLTELPRSIGNLVSLEELTISNCENFRVLPASLCHLKALRNLHLSMCPIKMLPPDMSNLVSLEDLTIIGCNFLRGLPLSICQLKALRKLVLDKCHELEELPPDMGNLINLQLLRISDTDVSSPPPSFYKITRIPALQLSLDCTTIEWLHWLEHFVDLKGTVILRRLGCLCNSKVACCANLASMHNLQRLILDWQDDLIMLNDLHGLYGYENVLQLFIHDDGNASSEIDLDDQPRSLMVCFQPHPNLKDLEIVDYPGRTFPEWIRNPTICASLERIVLNNCKFITFLPFGSLYRLKYLILCECSSLQFIREESLPLLLEEIGISRCEILVSVGIKRLEFLVNLEITDCSNLWFLDPCGKADTITVSRCPKLRDLCSHYGIEYKVLNNLCDLLHLCGKFEDTNLINLLSSVSLINEEN